MTPSIAPLLGIVGATFFWASASVVSKILLHTIDPFTLAFWRFLVAGIVILPFFLKEKLPSLRFFIEKILPVVLFSALNITFFYLGLRLTTANSATLIYSASPLITAILAKIMLHEKMGLAKIVGLGIGFLGVMVILLLPLFEKGEVITGSLSGNLLIFIAVISWTFYTIGSRRLLTQGRLSPLLLTSITIFVSCIIFFAVTLFVNINFVKPLLVTQNLLLIIHLGIVVTVFSYLLYQWALKHTSAVTASLTTYIQPIFAVSLAWIFLGEKITVGFVAGGILVFIGVILTSGTKVVTLFHSLGRNRERNSPGAF